MLYPLVPAEAGTQILPSQLIWILRRCSWIPAFAGMSGAKMIAPQNTSPRRQRIDPEADLAVVGVRQLVEERQAPVASDPEHGEARQDAAALPA
jgi:hypothetical protein